MVSCSQQAPSKPSERPPLDSRIPDFDVPSAGCGVGGRKKFTAKDPSTSADRPKSAPAERIWQELGGEVHIFGSKLVCELAAGSKVSRIQAQVMSQLKLA